MEYAILIYFWFFAAGPFFVMISEDNYADSFKLSFYITVFFVAVVSVIYAVLWSFFKVWSQL